MNLKPDILEKIISDFGDRYSKVIDILEKAFSDYDYLQNDRIIRCIIFLSEKSIQKLRQTIEVAAYDPRDVMFWAEYTNREELETPKRVRDFNKTFEESEINIKEI